MDKIDVIKKENKHYIKLLKRWKCFNSGIKYSGRIISGTLVISSPIIGLFTAEIGLPIILASAGILDELTTELINKIINSRIHKYKDKIADINSLLDKLNIFINRAAHDKIITEDELVEFETILKGKEKIEPIPKNSDQVDLRQLQDSVKLLSKQIGELKK